MASSREDRFVNVFAHAPWWVSVGAGVFVIVVMQLGAYSLAFSSPVFHPLARLLSSLWWAPAILFGILAILSKVFEKLHAAALARHSSLQSLRMVPWREFESLVGALYRQQGYTVLENSGVGPDGGVDLMLRKDGQRILVQCKRLSSRKVTVQQVREFFGVVVAKGATRGVFVTTSEFTAEAMEFGLRQAALELIPGRRLMQMIQGPADNGGSCCGDSTAVSDDVEAPSCPKCEERMVSRQARRGREPGSKFWGCPR